MRTAGALKLNEQLQPIGTQMGHFRSEHREETAYPRIYMKHPGGLEFFGMVRAENLCEALDVADVRTVVQRQSRAVHNPDPLALNLIQMHLEAIKIGICTDFWKKSGGCVVQRDISFCDTDELKNRFHYSGRRRAPEILSAYHKDGKSLPTGTLACLGSDARAENGADSCTAAGFDDTDERGRLV